MKFSHCVSFLLYSAVVDKADNGSSMISSSKKAKKGGTDSANANITVKVKSKSKRGKKEKPLGVRKEGDRTQFLKSVFGGGGV